MKTVLMIAPYFLPRRRVGSLRPFRFAIHLRKFGWEPVVLTLAVPGQSLTRLEQRLLGDIRIIEIKPPFDRTTQSKRVDVKSASADRGNDLASRLSDFVDRHTPVDTWIYLFMIRYLSILRTVRDIQPDLIWCTGDPWSGLWLGNKLSRDLSLPLITDFRDPWTLGKVNLRQRSHFSLAEDRATEREIIEHSEAVVFTSEKAASEYREQYGMDHEKAAVIYNSFCSDLITHEPAEEVIQSFSADTLNLLFLGEFRRLSPAAPVIGLLKEMKKIASDSVQKVRIHSFGSLTNEDQEKIKSHGLEKQFIVHRKILPEQVHTVMEAADLLLLTTNPKRTNIIPAKLWDYLSTNRPILSITPNDEIEMIISKISGAAHFSPGQLSEAAGFLIKWIESKEKFETPIAVEPEKREQSRKKFESGSTTAELASIFDRVISDGH